MELEKHLLSINGQVVCEMCGQCCPRTCPNKEEDLCNAHPAVTGKKDERDYICRISPIELATMLGFACPPVTRLIEELTDSKLDKCAGRPGEIRYNTQELKAILKRDIT